MKTTSLSAYEKIKRELGRRQDAVINTLKIMGEANNLMIAKKMNLPINSITPRVLELRKMGFIKESYRDRCPITKRLTIFWVISSTGNEGYSIAKQLKTEGYVSTGTF